MIRLFIDYKRLETNQIIVIAFIIETSIIAQIIII